MCNMEKNREANISITQFTLVMVFIVGMIFLGGWISAFNDNDRISSDLSTYKSRYSTCGSDLSSCNSQLSSSQSGSSSCNNQLNSYKSSYSSCNSDLNTCNSNLNYYKSITGTCGSDLSSCNINLNSYKDSYNSCQSSYSTCNSNLNTATSNYNSLKSNLDVMAQNYVGDKCCPSWLSHKFKYYYVSGATLVCLDTATSYTKLTGCS